MEAALRTAYETLTDKELADVNFTAVRGIEGVKEATVMVGDMPVKVAVANSTSAASQVMDKVKAGTADYTFIEVMACPGGCVNGGGQPIVSPEKRIEADPRVLRAKALYDEDAGKPLRKSHENPSIKKIYSEYFEQPNSHKSHELLHTTYQARAKYGK